MGGVWQSSSWKAAAAGALTGCLADTTNFVRKKDLFLCGIFFLYSVPAASKFSLFCSTALFFGVLQHPVQVLLQCRLQKAEIALLQR
jgi:hypothetical protein